MHGNAVHTERHGLLMIVGTEQLARHALSGGKQEHMLYSASSWDIIVHTKGKVVPRNTENIRHPKRK
jgi:hypothetical protein